MIVEGSWRNTQDEWARPSNARVIEVCGCPSKSQAAYRLLIEREESYDMNSAKLILRYFDLDNQDPRIANHPFAAEYRKLEDGRESISLTRGSVLLSLVYLRGHYVGTYLQDEIVRWARQWPNAIVTPITLSATDADDVINKMRRNRFYEQFGIVFEYDGTDRTSGVSMPMLAIDLKPVDPHVWQSRLKEHSLMQYLRRVDPANTESEDEQETVYSPRRSARPRVMVLVLGFLAVASIGAMVWPG